MDELNVGRVVVAVTEERLRAEVLRLLSGGDREVVLCEPDDAPQMAGPDDAVILYTDDDLVWLIQVVYEMRESGNWANIVVLLSPDQIARNPRLAMWGFRGRAAVSCVWAVRGGEIQPDVHRALRQIAFPKSEVDGNNGRA